MSDVLALIPARGGSKSVPLKNIAPLAGRPLLSYVVAAAREALGRSVSRVVCSTDSDLIGDYAVSLGVELFKRPGALATDDALVADVVRDVLKTIEEREGCVPAITVLFQPTSPFVLPQHVDGLVQILRDDPSKDTAQTIAALPHNFHAYNQRSFENGEVGFFFERERRAARNKQSKPKLFRFGNLLAFRSAMVLEGGDCFGQSSGGFEIAEVYAQDVDAPADFDYADYLISTRQVELPRGLAQPDRDIRPK